MLEGEADRCRNLSQRSGRLWFRVSQTTAAKRRIQQYCLRARACFRVHNTHSMRLKAALHPWFLALGDGDDVITGKPPKVFWRITETSRPSTYLRMSPAVRAGKIFQAAESYFFCPAHLETVREYLAKWWRSRMGLGKPCCMVPDRCAGPSRTMQFT